MTVASAAALPSPLRIQRGIALSSGATCRFAGNTASPEYGSAHRLKTAGPCAREPRTCGIPRIGASDPANWVSFAVDGLQNVLNSYVYEAGIATDIDRYFRLVGGIQSATRSVRRYGNSGIRARSGVPTDSSASQRPPELESFRPSQPRMRSMPGQQLLRRTDLRYPPLLVVRAVPDLPGFRPRVARGRSHPRGG